MTSSISREMLDKRLAETLEMFGRSGGPAHPVIFGSPDSAVFIGTPGISVREHYAGLAMQALLSSQETMPIEKIAAWSFCVADEMLEAGSKPPKPPVAEDGKSDVL